jgi:hypothetical protein
MAVAGGSGNEGLLDCYWVLLVIVTVICFLLVSIILAALLFDL